MVLLSVIITIYNIENYIMRCIDSILPQINNQIEIILVNDGSTDRSGEICQKYAKANYNIRFFSKENGGPSSARNVGMRKATGKYICFFDGDDYIQDNYLELILGTIEKNNCDIVIFDFVIFPNFQTVRHNFLSDKVISGFELLSSNPVLHSSNDLCPVWRSIYNYNNLKQHSIWFNEKIHYGEDFDFNLRATLCSKRTLATHKSGYVHVISRDDSLMQQEKKPEYDNSLNLQYLTRKNVYGIGEQYDRDLYQYYFEVIFWKLIKNRKNIGTVNIEYLIEINNYIFIQDTKNYFGLFFKPTHFKQYFLYLIFYFNLHRLMLKYIDKI